ncbi:MAG TPA: 30S ribosomal protein S16 [bacterium]|jgi:small subunit ribosomal protein S16|nr:30S ribosomal protein S16 [bacterium]HOA18340.1 30S ribosomal protein S16 [bacterium]
MSITIRLARIGRKNLPSFRMVAANTKDKRNGRSLEILGHYNPSEKGGKFEYDKERFEYWKKNGALISKSVMELIEGKYTFKPYNPSKNKKESDSVKESEEKTE